MKKPKQELLNKGLNELRNWNNGFGEYSEASCLQVSDERAQTVFTELTERLKGNYPFGHPVYAGQMLKPPHPLTWAAYALGMTINPNNHALDGGPPSSEMEKEAVAWLAQFLGYDEDFLGHLTASGTIANLEALWVARQLHPNKKIAFSENAHYTHQRMCKVLEVDSLTIPVQENGQLKLDAIPPEEIGTVVVTLGTTGLGNVEPLHHLLPWAKEYGIRIHVDAAYGGFYRLLKDSGLIDPAPWLQIPEADSIVIDPHKHGLQPYGCGCVLFKDPAVGRFYKHDSPYTYFSSDDLHLGEISLECSRAGAAAVALWTTLQLFPLKENDGFGLIMAECRKAALKFYSLLKDSPKLTAYQKPELDIVGYFPAEEKTTSEISAKSKQVFEAGMRHQEFYVSLYRLPAKHFIKLHPEYKADSEEMTILRSVFMKPEHHDFAETLLKRMTKYC